MKIVWQGHACFRVEGSEAVVVCDPYKRLARLRPMEDPADVVIRSSTHDPYHNGEAKVPGEHTLIEALEFARGALDDSAATKAAANLGFEAFEVYERQRPGHIPAANAMYTFALDGIRVLHLGDLGHALGGDTLEDLKGRVDIMLVPAGDRITVALEDLYPAIETIAPRIVIPMHYQIPEIWLPRPMWMFPVEAFLSHYPEEVVTRHDSSTLDIDAADMTSEFEVHVLEALGADGQPATP